MNKYFGMTIAVALAALTTTSAFAGPCGKHEEFARTLGTKFGENRQSLGIANGAQVFELFVSAKGTWTLLATDTKGQSCVVAAGEAWQEARKVFAGLES